MEPNPTSLTARLVRFVGYHGSWHRAEFVMALVALVWGIQVLRSDIATMGTDVTYSLTKAMAPEWAWGAVFVVYGAVSLYGVIRQLHRWRRAHSLAGVFVWTGLAVLALIGNPASAAAPGWLVLAVGSALAYMSSYRCHVVDGGRCNDLAKLTLVKVAGQLSQARARVVRGQRWGDR